MPVQIVGSAAHGSRLHFQVETQRAQNPGGLVSDLRPDSVAGQDGNLLRHSCSLCLGLTCKPREAREALCFKFADGVGLFEREPDVIEPIEQAVLAEGIDIEAERVAIRLYHHLALKVDFKLIARS